MRFVDLFNAISSGAPAALAAERHYLQFDGTSDYAVADAVFGGISGDYTIAIKVAGRNANASTEQVYFASGGAGTNASAQSRRDRVSGTGASTFFIGKDTSDVTTYTSGGGGVAYPADAEKRVIAIKRAAVAADAFCRIVSTSGVEYTLDDTSATHQIPDHIAVGARVDDALAVVAGYGAVKLIGLVLTSAQVPDAELQAWLNATTAVGTITGIDHYWCASDISGATIPARVGTVALALTGPTSSDLVAWSP